jgi:aminoacylase
MKNVGMQYLEAIRRLNALGFTPRRTIVVSFVPDEEIGGEAGMGALVASVQFALLNVGVELDEGWATEGDAFPAFFAERCPWWFKLVSEGEPGHGSKLYDGGAMESLQAAVAKVMEFRAEQFDMVKNGAAPGSVVSVNLVALYGGVPASPESPYSEASFLANMQPSSAEAQFDMRLPPMSAQEMDDFEAAMEADWAPPGSNVSIHWVQQARRLTASGGAAVTARDEAGWWGVFRRSLASQGHDIVPEIFPAATDASYLRQEGIPSIGFSPMRRTPKLLHEHDEYLAADTFEEGIVIYEQLIHDLAMQPGFAGDERGDEELIHDEL